VTTIAVKKVDGELYRRVKALASLKGQKVGDVVNEALREWLDLASKNMVPQEWVEVGKERRLNNEFYEKIREDLLSSEEGKYVVISHQAKLGVFDTAEEAYAAAATQSPAQTVVAKLQERSPRTVEFGWSTMERPA
jgi:hypothetical protein